MRSTPFLDKISENSRPSSHRPSPLSLDIPGFSHVVPPCPASSRLSQLSCLSTDDYITKPFSVAEVLARVRANIRRVTQYAEPPEKSMVLTAGALRLDGKERTVTKAGERIELTAKEFDILKLLMANPKRVYTKAQLYTQVWNDAYCGDENAVSVHISRLRGKIEDDPRDPRYVATVWGIGYKLGEK